MTGKTIDLHNAYENNLKNISVSIPLNQVTAIIGVSGCGKSSLIYNVLAKEAQRREKMDRGTAKCLDYASRPKFDCINHLPYCMTTKQRGLVESSSSTLATVSGCHELLRAEFVEHGDIVGVRGNVINSPTISEIRQYLQKFYPNAQVQVYAVLCFEYETKGLEQLALLKAKQIKEAWFISSYDQFKRLRKISAIKELDNRYLHTILVPVPSLDQLEDYLPLAVLNFDLQIDDMYLQLDRDYFDLETGKLYQAKSSQLLSFNSTHADSGQCQTCHGLGLIETIDWLALIDEQTPFKETFLNIPLNKSGGYQYILLYPDHIQAALDNQGVSVTASYAYLTEEQKQHLQDLIAPKIFKNAGKPAIGKFITTQICPVCQGTRLNEKANAVKLYGASISDLLAKTVDDLILFFKEKALHHKKILWILAALQKATLGYLSLNRTTDTLSGGELQRLKLSQELHSKYNQMLYILDEPSAALHPYNNQQMIQLIKEIRGKGNTVILSEHNANFIRSSEHVIQLGEGSGEAGGRVIYQGSPGNLPVNDLKFQRQKRTLDLSKALKLHEVNTNNIQNQSFEIPLGGLVVVCGASGSGKSSLIHHALVPCLKQYLSDKTTNQQLIKNIENRDSVRTLVELSQSVIGINSRSIVATYLDLFDGIRNLYAKQESSQSLGLDKAFFSFNSIGGCEVCKGHGHLDGNVCPKCLGSRYQPEVADITIDGMDIATMLTLSVEKLSKLSAFSFLFPALEILKKMGLSHLSLGRTTPSLSGGEAQRVKLAKVLVSSSKKLKQGGTLFVLDEPTTGLSERDIGKIYQVFDEILLQGNSLVVIEHNLHVIANSDFVIDVGPGAGTAGGQNLYSGVVSGLLKHPISLTAKALRGEYSLFEEGIPWDDSELLKPKHYIKRTEQPDCHPFYVSQQNFEIEKRFVNEHNVVTDKLSHMYFASKDALFEFVGRLDGVSQISFNPYVNELYRYSKVPISIQRKVLQHLKKLKFKTKTSQVSENAWLVRVTSETLEQAYNFGHGWVTVHSGDSQYELFTRLVSLQDQLVGSPKVTTATFNLYQNSCVYCHGKGVLKAYSESLIISDLQKTILEPEFWAFTFKPKIKGMVSKFAKEKLFDFFKPFNQLSEHEKAILFFGFKAYKFLKLGGKATTLSDYIEWKGIYWLLEQLSPSEQVNQILNSCHDINCPFCKKGFNPEIEYYQVKGHSILAYFKNAD